MLRLLSSKEQERRNIWKSFKHSHVGFHSKAHAQSYLLSTYLPGFPSFFSFSSHHFLLTKLATTSTRAKTNDQISICLYKKSVNFINHETCRRKPTLQISMGSANSGIRWIMAGPYSSTIASHWGEKRERSISRESMQRGNSVLPHRLDEDRRAGQSSGQWRVHTVQQWRHTDGERHANTG